MKADLELNTVSFTQEALDVILSHLGEAYPDEGCGMMGGRDGEVTKAIPMRNAAPEAQRLFLYEFDPMEQVKAYMTLRDEGLEFLGTFHSHPNSAAYPSGIDVHDAREDVLYCIVSLRYVYSFKGDGVARVGCYRIIKDDYTAVWTPRPGKRWMDDGEIMPIEVHLP